MSPESNTFRNPQKEMCCDIFGPALGKRVGGDDRGDGMERENRVRVGGTRRGLQNGGGGVVVRVEH